MNPSTPSDSENVSSTTNPVTPVTPPVHNAHTDPISGEANAHPLGVGVGAVSAGAAGAVIGAILGPVGAVIGAAIGAVAGGLAGKELAQVEEDGPIADQLSLSTPETEPITEPGVPVREGAYAASQEQLAVPPYDRLSKDVGYKDAHEAEPLSASAVPRDIVPEPYQPAEPGDAEYKTPTRSDEVPEAAIATPPVPTVGDNPSSISDVPLAVGEARTIEPEPAVNTSPYTLDEAPPATGESKLADEPGDLTVPPLASFTTSGEVDAETAIREAAYFKYINRLHDGSGGDETNDWVEAEKQVLQK